MNRKTAWISTACVVGVGLCALAGTVLGSERPAKVGAAAAPSAKAGTKRVVSWRVTDPTSPEYKQWAREVEAARLGVDDVLEAFDGNLSPQQKSVVLDSLLDDLDRLTPAERRKLQERMAIAVLAEEVDADLGDVMGRLLRKLNSDEQQRELETRYWQLEEHLGPGNKTAIIDASGNRDFVESVLKDTAQPLSVRDQAIERAGELGSRHELKALVDPASGSDPLLRVTALRTLGEYAQDQEALQEVIHSASVHPETDSSGRDTGAAARVGVSESGVSGKSTVLCADWKERLVSAPAQNEVEFGRSMVAGKALARALLSDADAAAGARCIDAELVPVLRELLKGPTPEVHQLQLVCELATDLKGECMLRPTPACADSNDRRARFSGELALGVLPLLSGTGLEHYAQLLAR